MKLIWGIVFIAIGLFMLISALLKSNFIVYRLLVARSKMLWGEKVQGFYVIVGTVLTILGILAVFGIKW
ncbi:MAG: hypothetical protein H0Z30_09200 [Candidatus Marinimicrobia bacterium]|nr:hypothetical protein [Candidatus Neomarinimicrobiota bacterium]MCD6099958.1 hypothetical protein [Candidatus Neomarinimicrobiota bacterium]